MPNPCSTRRIRHAAAAGGPTSNPYLPPAHLRRVGDRPSEGLCCGEVQAGMLGGGPLPRAALGCAHSLQRNAHRSCRCRAGRRRQLELEWSKGRWSQRRWRRQRGGSSDVNLRGWQHGSGSTACHLSQPCASRASGLHPLCTRARRLGVRAGRASACMTLCRGQKAAGGRLSPAAASEKSGVFVRRPQACGLKNAL